MKNKTMIKEKKNIVKEEKQTIHIKLFIVILISVLAVISSVVFTNSRGTTDENIYVAFTASILNNNTGGVNKLVAGKEALLTFKITDNKTGKPVTGLHPEISFYLPGEHDETKEHKHFGIYHLTGGEVNMAKFQLFVLNSERGTMEVLDTFGNYDPRPAVVKKFGSLTSKVIRLKGSPKQKVADILASRYGDFAYATIPAENQVAVINTITHEVVKYINSGAMPGRMFLQPNSEFLWVSDEGDGSVSIIDTDNNILSKTVYTGKGYHQVAFSSENAYVTNSENDTVSIIKLNELQKVKDLDVHKGPYGIDFSKISNQIFVANIMQGTVTVIDTKTNTIKGYLPLIPGIETIRISPDGRKGVILNQHGNISYVIDAVNNSLIKEVKTGEAPIAVDFIDEYALVRNTYSPDVTFISMKDPGLSNNAMVGSEPTLTWMPHSIISTSYGDEALVTSPREGRIWFIHRMEGEPMAMNSVPVEYGADAMAIVENKLHETNPGTYEQYIVLDKEGPYIIELQGQKINSSFIIQVVPDLMIGFQTTLLNNSFVKGSPSTLQYQILDRKTGRYEEGLTDLIFVVVKPGSGKGTWTKRFASRYSGNGTYKANVIFPEEGEYMVTLNSNVFRSRGYEEAYDYVTVRNK